MSIVTQWRRLRCWFARHVWKARVVRSGSLIHVLATCDRCGRWVSSTCFASQEHSPMMPSNWFPVSSALMPELWARAVVFGEVRDATATTFASDTVSLC